LQLPLIEVKEGRVDVIVVYKVDRLTRSLADFAKLVEGVCHVGEFYWLILPSERGPDCAIPMA
jgi:hypothetical protein